MLAIFFKSLLIAFSGAVMPGSVFTYTVDRSLRHGVKAGVLVSLGHALLELILVILIFVGAGRYLAAESAGIAIGLIGGVVLVYLGSQMLKDVYLNKITLETGEMHDHKQGGMFMAGMVLSATNPYFLIWWSAVGLALIMSAYHSLGVWGIVIFYLGHILGDITWYTFVAAMVSKSRHLLNIAIYKTIIVVLALCLVGFGASFFAGSIKHII
ncbi:MAG TPA: LysE family transporter [Syntrophomonas sp.]|mgnify:CR=1 FL=1|nr:LysE family transporter [Syntrophomonas sp.]HRW12806.1 LysE family transporter [Syntrophomonas sp.]